MDENKLKPLNGTSFDLLVDVIGMRIAWKLCKHFSGQDLRVPTRLEGLDAQGIIKAIGEEGTQEIINACAARDKIYVPSKPLSMKRRKQVTLSYVKKRVSEGASTLKIANELRVTSRTIRNYRVKLGISKAPNFKKIPQSNSNATLTPHADKNRTNTPKPKTSAS